MLSKHYNPQECEPELSERWMKAGVYEFHLDQPGPVFSIDTPPPTVSGNLHLGHIYSYSHADFIARFWRMQGYRVFYPMGYDDNGLPTERLVEKRLRISAASLGRKAFIEKCLQVSEEAEAEYQHLWQRLGLSVDWRYTYRTIDERSRRISQQSFIDLYRKGLVYRAEAPAIWCPECRTAIAQAELNDLERETEFVTLAFLRDGGAFTPIATTRLELLPACVAVFVHPQDDRYRSMVGQTLRVPLFNQSVPVIADTQVDPEKGSGVVMCCTFGDSLDVAWWRAYQLPLIELLNHDGSLNSRAGIFAGLGLVEARRQILAALQESGAILGRQSTIQSVRVHERCDTPVEYLIARQWFVRVLDQKDAYLRIGDEIAWQPPQMKGRYRAWVENLNWDWCLSRQRFFGVPFPLWYCESCGQVSLAEEDQLPVDPIVDRPKVQCPCGGMEFIPEEDVMDTWATSSLSPQIVGQWSETGDHRENGLYAQVFPFSLRPQAHEIIRTWAFYTIVKSYSHFQSAPWKSVLISGWGIAGEGQGKISKSRGGGPLPPLEMIQRHSADAVRYWAASTGPGKDAVISEEKILLGSKLVNKLWNVARFSETFLRDSSLRFSQPGDLAFTLADRWILASLQSLVRETTALFQQAEYANAKSITERFFWHHLADNYLEMAKQRLYDAHHTQHGAACFVLGTTLLTLIKLFAPLLPYVTEQIYLLLFQPGWTDETAPAVSIHTSAWPVVHPDLESSEAQKNGDLLAMIASAVRRYKSEHGLPLSSPLDCLLIAVKDEILAGEFKQAEPDLLSVTRAGMLRILTELKNGFEPIFEQDGIRVAISSSD